MKDMTHHAKLTSAEIANLWTQYINDSLSICMLLHAIERVQDQEIKEVLKFSLEIAESHLEKIKEFFKQEGFPIPKGFSREEDVNLSAPPLFTDTFMMIYMQAMTLLGLTAYGSAVSTSTRADQVAYYIKCNQETMELHRRILEVMLNKGIYSRPPLLHPPSQVDFVNNQRFLTGWFGKKRPLNAMEISGVSFNMVKIIVKVVLEIGFAQVCQSNDIKEYFQRGKNICEKQFDTLNSILAKDDLGSPPSWVSEVTNSTVSPFSEKLMLTHVVILVSAAVGYYGAAMSVSQRRDLALDYTKLITEIALYAEDGAQLLINKGWMEQPPLAEDRSNLGN